MMSEDPLVGTMGFDFDIVSAGSATEITGTVEMEDGSRATLFTGIEGACTAAEALSKVITVSRLAMKIS